MNSLPRHSVILNISARLFLNTSARSFASKSSSSKPETKKASRKKSTDTTKKADSGTKKAAKSAPKAKDKVSKEDPAPVAPSAPEFPQDETAYKEYINQYKCPEYYGYNDMSFYDIENEMGKHRCQQPSAL